MIPDLPRWVEANAIAEDPASWRVALGSGFAVGSDRARLIVVVGDAPESPVRELAASRAGYAMLVAIEREDLAMALGARRAILHTLADPSELPEVEGAVLLPDDASLADVPAELAAELAAVRGDRPIWTVWVGGAPVSFAYAPWRSARWFDVSVDTLPGARQLGLGTIVATAMIRDERAHGREPVWGADEDNLGSLRLARRLGFTPSDALWVAPPR